MDTVTHSNLWEFCLLVITPLQLQAPFGDNEEKIILLFTEASGTDQRVKRRTRNAKGQASRNTSSAIVEDNKKPLP